MARPLPWSIDDSAAQLREASTHQQRQEEALKAAYRKWGKAKDAYAKALALKITELKNMGTAATLAKELAKGDEKVAELRMLQDTAEGEAKAAEQACWRRNADRKDAQALADWSQRREFAEARGDVVHQFEKPIGRAA